MLHYKTFESPEYLFSVTGTEYKYKTIAKDAGKSTLLSEIHFILSFKLEILMLDIHHILEPAATVNNMT